MFGSTFDSALLTSGVVIIVVIIFNHLYAELNPMCHLLALLGAQHILHVSRLRVKLITLES